MLRRTITAIALVTVCLAAGALSTRDSEAITGVPKVYTVDTISDANLTVCDRFTPNDCSLRGAINDANGNPNSVLGPDSISFHIDPGGIQTIAPTGPLPAITDAVVIDATGQGPASDNCGVGIMPCIRLDGSVAGGAFDGLTISAGGVTVRGMAIVGSSGGTRKGINITAGSYDTIAGNFIGTADGTTVASNYEDVFVAAAASHVTIGGTAAADRNLIAGALAAHLIISGTGNIVEGNYIGTNATGTAALVGAYYITSVDVEGANNTIGGTQSGAGNLISGGSTGLALGAGGGNQVLGNMIGPDASGQHAMGQATGIIVFGSSNNTIGGASAEARNVISGNSSSGVEIDSSSTGNTLLGNYIGTNAAGTAEAGDQGWGVYVSGNNNTIGGANAGEGNVISGDNLPDNAEIAIIDGHGNNVYGNLVGTNAAGDAAIPHFHEGILLSGQAHDNHIGGLVAGERNVISGNGDSGIILVGSTDTNEISDNYIGLNLAGDAAIPNSSSGIRFLAGSNTDLLQSNTISGNVISGNSGPGISFEPGNGGVVRANTIEGNIIGLNAAGTGKIPNTGDGIRISSATSATDHDNLMSNNVISGNGSDGIAVSGGGTTNNSIFGNYIGTNQNLDSGLGNAVDGLLIQASSHNLIGGSAATDGNVIMHNGGDGVRIDDLSTGAYADTISENSIDSNGGLGIHLIGQANNYQAAPVLDSATAGSTHVTGMLTSANSTQYTIEFFRSPACDGSGAGEGRTFLGSTQVMTSVSGVAQIDATLSAGTPAGQRVTATATSPAGDTSQFSNCVRMAGPTPTPSPTPSPTPTPTPIHHPTPTPSGGGILGDANCDGKVDTTDALDTLSQTGGVPPGAACPGRADVNCNGQVDADDALRILDYFAGAPRPQPSGCGQIGAAT